MPMEQDLPARLRQGDKDAFIQLYKLYYKQLCKYAYNLVKNLDVAEEMVQDVICKLWEKRSTLNIPDYLKEYLYKAVFNNCINYLKKKINDESHLKALIANNHKSNYEYNDFIVIKELEDNIHKAIATLPEKSGRIFKMNRFEGLTYAEIAVKTDMTVKGVEFHMSNALRQLSADLKEYLPLLVFILCEFLTHCY
jgi:RNA polymerase sigma-70 factor (ECF subfamily)